MAIYLVEISSNESHDNNYDVYYDMHDMYYIEMYYLNNHEYDISFDVYHSHYPTVYNISYSNIAPSFIFY